jgi:hypothetical protein
MSKQELGQFYTTNYEYILQNFKIPKDIKIIIEPFAGNGDLLGFIKDKKKYKIECYDIEPKKDYIIKKDTLKNPPCYNDKFILTNPPYLARNKNKNKELYDKYKCNDLYKCFITNIINSECLGGIIIIPLNFICSIRKQDAELRKIFLNKFNIEIINIFEEKVFDDTSYNICSIQFTKYNNLNKLIKCYSYLNNNKKIIELSLNEKNNYTIGGEIYKLKKNKKYIIERATKKSDLKNLSNILLKCIDDNNKINLSLVDDDKRFIDNTPNLSARSYATLIITPLINIDEQKKLINKFNNFIEENREKYNSLFLTNYRENSRKRISFELAFRICSYLI